ncbi:MAG TPA: thiolase family protein [Spirochaetota bacterium]|nr:thiolase family protein [Spirochaetota bacterium]HOD14492.1 thiolase family protein [Spirochaetota bacterium]HPG50491.1 thiolase family protein [Spirochaetota bacterium]HPN11844.1 thiolase family protein [Spirochaetota bacterium]
MRDVYVLSAHTIKFGRYLEKSVKDLAAETVIPCLKQAGLEKKDLQALWFANSGWGYGKGQDSIRAQVALRPLGIEAIPMTNVENACAGGSTAFHHAWLGVASGLYDVTMAVGAEKINDPNKMKVFAGFLGGLDIENIAEIIANISVYGMNDEDRKNMDTHIKKYAQKKEPGNSGKKRKKPTTKEKMNEYWDMFKVYIRLRDCVGAETVKDMRKLFSGDHSPFMDVYGYAARQHMRKYGSTPEQLAVIASKNHYHSSLNPNAQYTFTVTPEQVLADRMVTWPLTRGMCAPIGDGAASAILCDLGTVKRLGLMSQAVKIRASVLGSGRERAFEDTDIGERLSKIAYEKAGLGPSDMHLAEVHDATAYGELHQAEALGFCREGDGGILAQSGATKIGGKIPINPSGGLESRGHPIGASGLAQIHELVTQLRGAAGPRQVQGAKIAIAENGGGALGQEEAAMCIHILEAPAK